MRTIREVSGGSYDSIEIEGYNRNTDIGAFIRADTDVVIESLRVSNVFIPFIVIGKGRLIIKSFDYSEFGGDGANIRKSNANINHWKGRKNTPTRPYNSIRRIGNESIEECLLRNNELVYDPSLLEWEDGVIKGYHQDAILQAYAVKKDGYTLDENGCIENITIKNIDVVIDGDKSQGLICSEKNDINNWELGTETLNITAKYQHPILFNTARNTKIGCESAKMSGSVRIINKKRSAFISENVETIGVRLISDIKDNHSKGSDMKYQTLKEHASRLNVEYAVLMAIALQESMKTGFRRGRPVILFECHVFERSLKDVGIDPANAVYEDKKLRDIINKTPYKSRGSHRYGSYKNQWDRFNRASKISEEAAIMACSWGQHQVLGEGYNSYCGYDSINEFREAQESKEGQLDTFIRFIEGKNGLIEALRSKDWYTIKKLYQGSKYHDENNDGVDDYVASLKKHYTRLVLQSGSRKQLVKSRTMRNNTAGAALKVGGGLTGALGFDSAIESMNAITSEIGKIETIKSQVSDVALKIDQLASSMIETQKFSDSISWMPYAIVLVAIVALYPHLRVAYAYLQDNGYIDTSRGIE